MPVRNPEWATVRSPAGIASYFPFSSLMAVCKPNHLSILEKSIMSPYKFFGKMYHFPKDLIWSAGNLKSSKTSSSAHPCTSRCGQRGAPFSKLGEKGAHHLDRRFFVELVGAQEGHCSACLPKGGKATLTTQICREVYRNSVQGLQWDILVYVSSIVYLYTYMFLYIIYIIYRSISVNIFASILDAAKQGNFSPSI